MRLVTFDGGRVGRLTDGEIIDVSEVVDRTTTAIVSTGRMRRLIESWDDISHDVLSYRGESLRASAVRLDPVVDDPSKVLAAPVNYVDHQTEMRVDAHVSALGLFLKSPASVLGAGGVVSLPYYDRRFDQEGELAVVIGREAWQVSEQDALSYVFGYTGLFDITMRGGEDRSTRKSFRSFTPIGPCVVTADEFGDPRDVNLRCWVNGELRQRANTRDLIWDVPKLVSYASWISPLQPGDVITTGTPAGVGEIHDGDDLRLELSGLGSLLEVTVSSAGAVASHTIGKDRGVKPPGTVTPLKP